MRLVTVLILTLAMEFSLSCAKKSEGPLKVFFKPDSSFILPGTHKFSCYEGDIIGPRLYYPRMDITWAGPGRFFPAIIKIRFRTQNLGGEYECTISQNITFLYQKESDGSSVTENFFETQADGSPETYVFRDGCALECGTIQVKNEDQSFKVPGEVKLIGYAIDDNEVQKPYTARATIYLQNLN